MLFVLKSAFINDDSFYEPNAIATINHLLRRTLIRAIILIISTTKWTTCFNHSQY
jgi:hypothetical protein